MLQRKHITACLFVTSVQHYKQLVMFPCMFVIVDHNCDVIVNNNLHNSESISVYIFLAVYRRNTS